MKNHPISFLLLVSLFIFTAAACTSIDKLVDTGNYDEAIALAQRKMSGKQAPNPKYIAAARQALEAANDRDLRNASRLREQGASTDWTRVFRIYRDIDKRQEKIRPLLPLVDKQGIKTDFTFVRVEPLLAEARSQAAEQLYQRGRSLLAEGERGDKASARAAYQSFEEVQQYLSNYRDTPSLMRQAEVLGIVYVTLQLENATRAYLPAGFEQELLAVNTKGMDSRWRRFHLPAQSGLAYDYHAKIVIRQIDVSPERISERSYTDEKEVTDGEEYVLDVNGNVAKDSLGNDIKRPRKVIVRAEVLEVYQTKSAIVQGELLLFDSRSGRQLDRRALTGEAIFEHYASTFNGDRRALSSDSRNRIGNRPAPFPSSETLILEAADHLKPILQEELAASFQLI